MFNFEDIGIYPMEGWAMIEAVAAKEKLDSGLYVTPVHPHENMGHGEVLTFLPKKGHPISLERGDEIYYKKYSVNEVEIGDRLFCLVHVDDILLYTRKRNKEKPPSIQTEV
jgi:co-chaperonin GroES (HSP10)